MTNIEIPGSPSLYRYSIHAQFGTVVGISEEARSSGRGALVAEVLDDARCIRAATNTWKEGREGCMITKNGDVDAGDTCRLGLSYSGLLLMPSHAVPFSPSLVA